MVNRGCEKDGVARVASAVGNAFKLLTLASVALGGLSAHGQISLHVPPAQPIATVGQGPDFSPDRVEPVPTLLVAVYSSDGTIESIEIGIPGKVSMRTVDLPQLREKLQAILRDSAGAIEQVVVEASPRLRYRELMRIVAAAYQAEIAINPDQKVGKLSLVSTAKSTPKRPIRRPEKKKTNDKHLLVIKSDTTAESKRILLNVTYTGDGDRGATKPEPTAVEAKGRASGADELNSLISKEKRAAMVRAGLTERDLASGDKELPDEVVIRADETCQFEGLELVIETCQKNGFRRFTFEMPQADTHKKKGPATRGSNP
jgi:biopolymer transport protein ExbD